MANRRLWCKFLLWLHLLVCMVWLYLFRAMEEPPGWMWHVLIWSILGIQFTWGYTVGLIIGPSRKRRPLLWWSLLTVFMPLYFMSFLFRGLSIVFGLPIALVYYSLMVAMLACETFGGILLGVRTFEKSQSE